MRFSTRSFLHLGAGALALGALAACEAHQPVSVEDRPSQQSEFRFAQCVPVDLDAVYSGPPARENFTIDLNDQYVYVEVYDIQQYLPRAGATANDVRLGDTWETGTPAQQFEILDIDGDGRRDIRLRYVKSQLVADGNLDQQTTEVRVWGLDRTDNGEYCGSAEVDVILPPPAAGQDVVVFNDLNIFDNGALAQGTGNAVMIRNLVTFTSEGSRDEGTVVMWDRGRNSRCGPPPGNSECLDGNLSTTRSVIEDEGFEIVNIMSGSGTLVDIPADVKSLWLWLPQVAYTVAEINALKQFASEGGRIVFIGEHQGFYGDGIPIQNDFLQKMGAVMRNVGDAINCGYTYLPGSSIVDEHQVMSDVADLTIACASVIEPGPQDFVLFYDTSRTHVLAGVARIDTTPLSGVAAARSAVPLRGVPSGVSPRSATGR